MKEFSILIGGKAGFGIDKASSIIARILNQLNYRIYIYRDYPSLIRGGHTFSIIRASTDKIAAHREKIDFLLALNQDTLNFHKNRLKDNSLVIYDPDSVKLDNLPGSVKAIPVSISKIVKEENASEIMRNTCIVGSLCKVIGITWQTLETVFKKSIGKDIDLNLKIARRGFDGVNEQLKTEPLNRQNLPILAGNEALSLGLIKAGLSSYIAYPMTPSSGILHFMADVAEDFGLTVIHPESEISVILMALGCAYAGKRVAIGTSGGGFCLMTEAFSFAGMAELPVVVVVGQRPGPSTGLPTYTSQTELNFVINAGQGEFPRLVVAPGDAEEAYYWSAIALNIAWKYRMPVIVLTDKTLAEGIYNFDLLSAGEAKEEPFSLTGVSPLAFVPKKDSVVKINSYEHDESGITTEDPAITKTMQEKRLRKKEYLIQELDKYNPIKIYGKKEASNAIICWGSNKSVCIEVAETLGLKVVIPVVLWPLPVKQLQDALRGVKNLICVENNATAQLTELIKPYGIDVNSRVLKYDGRPFSIDELEGKLKELIR